MEAQDFGAFEEALRREALGIAAQMAAARFNADHSDRSGSTIACACGRPAQYVSRRPKTFITLMGPMRLERAYYYCPACRRGGCPRDRALDLQDTSLSPATTRLVGMTAAEVSFAKASELLAALAGVEVETRQVERCAEALGREIAGDECAVREQTAPAPAPTMYLGLDGTGVPVRPTEVAGRRGKQPDGSAKTREVKLATVWTAEGRDPEGRPCRDPGSVSYNAAVESAASRDTDPQPAAFPQRAHREAQRRGFVKQHLSERGQGHPRGREGARQPVGTGPEGRVGRRTLPRSGRGAAHPSRDARGASMHPLHRRQPPPDALSAVPGPGPVRVFGRRRGRVQADRRTAQARRYALDRRRCQRPALLHPQRPLRRLLGATSREGRLTPSNNDVVHPGLRSATGHALLLRRGGSSSGGDFAHRGAQHPGHPPRTSVTATVRHSFLERRNNATTSPPAGFRRPVMSAIHWPSALTGRPTRVGLPGRCTPRRRWVATISDQAPQRASGEPPAASKNKARCVLMWQYRQSAVRSAAVVCRGGGYGGLPQWCASRGALRPQI